MDMYPVNAGVTTKQSTIWLGYLCFIVLGMLLPFSKSEIHVITVILSVLIALGVGMLNVNLLLIIFKSGKKELQQFDSRSDREAVGAGMMYMVPFTVLALLAFFAFGWNAVTPFASGAITTASAMSGAEAVKRGMGGKKNVLIPTVIALVLSTIWMALINILP